MTTFVSRASRPSPPMELERAAAHATAPRRAPGEPGGMTGASTLGNPHHLQLVSALQKSQNCSM